MRFKLGFSWLALMIFLLPMLVNIVYVLIPPVNAPTESSNTNRILEFIEQTTRILYLIALTVLVSDRRINWKSPWMVAALVFLLLYYIVWMRYFMGGRDVALLGKSFCFVPMPLAVFPVLYFICAAIWMNNPVAVGFMIVFGIVHNIISYQTFQR